MTQNPEDTREVIVFEKVPVVAIIFGCLLLVAVAFMAYCAIEQRAQAEALNAQQHSVRQ